MKTLIIAVLAVLALNTAVAKEDMRRDLRTGQIQLDKGDMRRVGWFTQLLMWLTPGS